MSAGVSGRPRRLRPLVTAVVAFRRSGWRNLLQVKARVMTAPLWEIERLLPVEGRVLEVGCGRGLLTSYLALASLGRDLTGIDIDPRKIEVAAGVASAVRDAGGSVRFALLPPGVFPDGDFDAVVFAEMLYLLLPSARQELVIAAAKKLTPGGIIVVKEVDSRPWWKDAVNRFGSVLDMRVLHNLAGETIENLGPEFYEKALVEGGLTTTSRRLDRWYPYAHFVVVGQRLD